MDNTTRKLNIIRMRRNNPCATLQEIGNNFRISRERVRQILVKAGTPTRHFVQRYICLNCGEEITSSGKLFCSRECNRAYHTVTLPCSECGNKIELTISKVLNRYYNHERKVEGLFCSKECWGNYAGRNYGFIAHPENIILRVKKRKWDYSKVYELRDKTNWGCWRLSRALGIPEQTIAYILRKRGDAQ